MATGDLHLKRLDQKVSVYQTLSREWRPHLDANELLVMLWLTDVICGFGRHTDTFTRKQMLEGVSRQGYELPGLGDHFADRKLRYVLASLVAKGFIYKRQMPACVEITINLDWPKVQGEENVVHLKTPKKKTSGRKIGTQTDETAESECREPGNQSAGNPADGAPEAENTPKGWHSDATQGGTGMPPSLAQPCHPSKQDLNNTQNSRPSAGVRQRRRVGASPWESDPAASGPENENRAGAAGETTRDAVKSATATSRKRADEKASLAKTRTNPGAYEQTWKRAVAEHFPSVEIPRQWSKAEYGHVKALVRLMPKDGEQDGALKLHDVIEFCVANWSQIVNRRLSWMKAAPSVPTIKFFVQQSDVFLSAYAEHNMDVWIESLPEEERKLERLVKSGMSREEAFIKIAEDRAALKMREANEQAKDEAARYFRMAKLAARNSAPVYGTHNPHPRAHENQRPKLKVVETSEEELDQTLAWMDEIAAQPNPFDEE